MEYIFIWAGMPFLWLRYKLMSDEQRASRSQGYGALMLAFLFTSFVYFCIISAIVYLVMNTRLVWI